MNEHLPQSLELNGFMIAKSIINYSEIKKLSEEIPPFLDNYSAAGVRNIANLSVAIKELSISKSLLKIIKPILGSEAKLVRSILFNKTPEVNWKVTWHQDLSIAVKEKVETENYGPWSIKAGVVHVQPPLEILENILTIRIHLDNANEENGALIVLPKSHLLGKLKADKAPKYAKYSKEYICNVESGDAVIMRPLLLHSSRKSLNKKQRRVIHFEFSSAVLPIPLEWHNAA